MRPPAIAAHDVSPDISVFKRISSLQLYRYLTMLGRLFSKLLWAPHQGSADAIFGVVDDRDNGGVAAGFAESNPDLQFGEIWDRTFFFYNFPLQICPCGVCVCSVL